MDQAPDARFAGATLAASPFAGDTGEVAGEVAEALAGYARDPTTYATALAALAASRVLVPVVAVAEEVTQDEAGLRREKTSRLEAAFLQLPDGRRALLAFTGTGPLHSWDPLARPVPTATREAASTALHGGATTLLVDIAGPVRLAVRGDALRALAAGWTPARVGDQDVWIGSQGE